MYTPGQAAAHLKIEPSTLRRWARQFQGHLSPAAGPGAARRYTDDDLVLLEQIKTLLGEGKTVAEVRGQLNGYERMPDEHEPSMSAHERMPDEHTQVLLLDQHQPERDALRSLLAAQQQLVQQQRQHIEDQAALIDQQQQTLESRDQDLERVRADLERSQAQQAALLADVRAMLDRLPRWVKRFWGV